MHDKSKYTLKITQFKSHPTIDGIKWEVNSETFEQFFSVYNSKRREVELFDGSNDRIKYKTMLIKPEGK